MPSSRSLPTAPAVAPGQVMRLPFTQVWSISGRSWSSEAIQNTGTTGRSQRASRSRASRTTFSSLKGTYSGPPKSTSWWPVVTVRLRESASLARFASTASPSSRPAYWRRRASTSVARCSGGKVRSLAAASRPSQLGGKVRSSRRAGASSRWSSTTSANRWVSR